MLDFIFSNIGYILVFSIISYILYIFFKRWLIKKLLQFDAEIENEKYKREKLEKAVELEKKLRDRDKDKEGQLAKSDHNEEIIEFNIQKPIGKYTTAVFLQKRPFLKIMINLLAKNQRLPKNKRKGLWEVTLEARRMAPGQGKNKNKGR